MLGLLAFFLLTVRCQFGVNFTLNGGAVINIFHESDLGIFNSPGSSYYPNDFIVNTHVGLTNVYLLESNNVLQIYNKLNLSVPLQTFTNYSYASGEQQKLTFVSSNTAENTLVITTFWNSGVKHRVLGLSVDIGVMSLNGVYGNIASSDPPSEVFLRQNKIYAYFRSSTSNDSFQITNILTNTTSKKILPCSNCDIEVSPNCEKALVWDSSSRVYIYSMATETLNYTYEGSLTSSKDYTNMIPISDDSGMAIIETGTSYPVRVYNLTSNTVQHNITGIGITSLSFLDSSNRFVIIRTLSKTQIYDLLHQTLTNTSYSFGDTIRSAQSGLLFDYQDNIIKCYGVNITDGSNKVASYPWAVSLPAQSSSTSTNTTSTNSTNITTVNSTNTTTVTPTLSQNITSINITNTTVEPSHASYQQPTSTDPAADFYLILEYTQAQNKTLTLMQEKLVILNACIEKIFGVIFSSPLAVQFLGLFNYFMLCSLYILINIKIPYEVFRYLSLFFKSTSGNVLTLFGLSLNCVPPSPQRVTDQRPLYFNLSSDFISQNKDNFAVMILNVLAYEFLILVMKLGGKKVKKVKKSLIFLRTNVYWGLLVSNMIPFILTWRYSFWGGATSFSTKTNLICQYLSIIIIFFLVICSFLYELSQAKKAKKSNQVKTALKEWWDGYENFIYPLLILLPSPIYFMIIICFSNLISLYNSFYAPKWKFFMVLKASYPFLFHCCFIIFMIFNDSFVLAITVIVCLIVFLAGSLHNIMESVVLILNFVRKFIKKRCCRSKEEEERKEKKVNFKMKGGTKTIQTLKVKKDHNVKKKKKEDVKKTVDIKEIIARLEDELNAGHKAAKKNENRIKDQFKNRTRVKTTKDKKEDRNMKVDWISRAKVTLVYQ